MRKLNNIRLLPTLMAISIIAIAAFQFYWLRKAYQREDRTLEMRTNILFREAVRDVQASKLKLDKIYSDSNKNSRIIISSSSTSKTKMAGHNSKIEGMLDVVMQKVLDSNKGTIVYSQKIDSVHLFNKPFRGRDRMIQFLFDLDSLQDSIKIKELDSALAKRLHEQNMVLPFKITRVPTKETEEPVFNEVTLGIKSPTTYHLDLGSTNSFIVKRIGAPIIFSIFLVGFTLLSFSLLYRNLLHQHRLANIKNEFISNITHELKTPIATVSVAIEALRSFNASLDPEKSKEYLDISSNELQRLSLLVDKVLKLSMFEKKEVELQYETLDMKELVEEVTSSMRLQFEKHHAQVNVNSVGDTTLEADRLHLVSVIFNLIDNAIKYSPESPKIDININGDGNKVDLVIKDSGIGIPQEYQNKIFEKFFRVPTGNLHNAKGYGLGLSYVSHVISRHKGTINVKSIPNDGSEFCISLPKYKS